MEKSMTISVDGGKHAAIQGSYDMKGGKPLQNTNSGEGNSYTITTLPLKSDDNMTPIDYGKCDGPQGSFGLKRGNPL